VLILTTVPTLLPYAKEGNGKHKILDPRVNKHRFRRRKELHYCLVSVVIDVLKPSQNKVAHDRWRWKVT
jgi:hypothetical protein